MTPEELAVLVRLHHGDCLDVMRAMPDASVDSIVTDPPYGLGFMGKAWDALPPGREWAEECLRVLKPGGHLLAFGGTRTWHRLAVAVEDAGFELRDSIAWLYGSGFPKSLDVSKAIDKAAGAVREVVGLNPRAAQQTAKPDATSLGRFAGTSIDLTAPATDEARQWAGWGTALKPAFEPVVVGRKALQGTVASNVLQFGTGALNIDASRTATNGEKLQGSTVRNDMRGGQYGAGHKAADDVALYVQPDGGRWPANVILDESQAAVLDEQSGTLKSGANPTRRGADATRDAYGEFKGQEECTPARGVDTGGASRFFPTFRYQAKAPAKERPKADGVSHPTVKPLDLMRWLVRLVTPPGGVVLDPFLGSGTTAEACALEGFRCIGIEREAPYLHLTVVRLSKHLAAPTERTA